MSVLTPAATRARLDGLSRAGLNQHDFYFAALSAIKQAVPYDAMCIGAIDPATNIVTDSAKVDLVEDGDREFLVHEYAIDDFNQFADMAAKRRSTSILHTETGGDPERSARFRDVVRPILGAAHELRGIARMGGLLWGAYAVYRGQGSPAFTEDEAALLARFEQVLARGMRAGSIVSVAERALDGETGPAVLVYDRSGRLRHATATAEERVRDLGGDVWGRTAVAVTSIIAVSQADANRRSVTARLRVRGLSGRWFTLHSAPFTDGDVMTSIAVTIEPSSPPEILPLIIAAYGLTEREGRIVLLMLRGESTHGIAQALTLSPYTVQDHFKSIFEKVGVSSRRELSSNIFFSQYAGSYGEKQTTAAGDMRVMGALGGIRR